MLVALIDDITPAEWNWRVNCLLIGGFGWCPLTLVGFAMRGGFTCFANCNSLLKMGSMLIYVHIWPSASIVSSFNSSKNFPYNDKPLPLWTTRHILLVHPVTSNPTGYQEMFIVQPCPRVMYGEKGIYIYIYMYFFNCLLNNIHKHNNSSHLARIWAGLVH